MSTENELIKELKLQLSTMEYEDDDDYAEEEEEDEDDGEPTVSRLSSKNEKYRSGLERVVA